VPPPISACNCQWRGEGLEEQGIDTHTGRIIVRVDPRYFRPTEVESLLGDPAKARARLGWPRRSLLRPW